MLSNYDDSFELLIKSEGGYVNNPADPGGETNLGVTKKAWAAYLGRPVATGEMAKLTKVDVKPFYKTEYWDKTQCDLLPKGVDYLAFDFAVNAGVSQCAKFIQRACGAEDDGHIGPGTLNKVAMAKPCDLVDSISAQKRRFYKELVAKNPGQRVFLDGWLRRVDQTQFSARGMSPIGA